MRSWRGSLASVPTGALNAAKLGWCRRDGTGAVSMNWTERLGFTRESEQEEADRLTGSLAGLAAALLLLVIGLHVVYHLESKAAIEDCLMAGRINCDALVVNQH
jgi:hypothetical protein